MSPPISPPIESLTKQTMNAAALAHLALCRSRYIGVGPDAGVDEHGGRAPLSYLLERDMLRHRFPFLRHTTRPASAQLASRR